MKNTFTHFLKGKGFSLLLTSLFLFYFGASQGLKAPITDAFRMGLKAADKVSMAVYPEALLREKEGAGRQGHRLRFLTANARPADPPGQVDAGAAKTFPPKDLSFQAADAAAPFAGTLAESGGPILVVHAASNPFSKYAAEILLAEGLSAYATADITTVTAGLLGNYDVVIVGDIPLTDAHVTLLSDWTNAGGTLIAFSPDPKLATLLGLTPAGSTMENEYLLVNTASGPGKGIANQTIQYQSVADLYTLNGATAVATLYAGPTTATTYPAVTLRPVGTQGGEAVAFTYDLARSVVYTRQGNPAWAGQKRDGMAGPIRSDDQSFPDWVDLGKVAIPMADEQQRLLANIILQNARKPMPRFWYLPRGLKATVVMTGDDHGAGGTVARFNKYLQDSPDNSAEAVADWRAIRGTSYIFPTTRITDAQAKVFQDQGFEIALHLNTSCANFTLASLDQNLTAQLAQFDFLFPNVSPPVTNRTHCIAWSDWHTQPKLEAPKGIRLDANYYYWPGPWVLDRPGMFSGSGIPMRFTDLDGALIDCYQLTTQMTDESEQTFPFTVNQLLDKALGAEGYYGAFCANMHTDAGTSDGSDKIIASAKARNVPVISAKQMLTWLDGRNGSSFGAMTWNGNTLNFSINVAPGARRLEAMLPITAATGPLTSLTVNGSAVALRQENIKGIDYAFFTAATGNYVAVYNSTLPPNVEPTVAITAPDNGTTYTAPASIPITADAADADGTIAKVEFYQGTTLLGQDVSRPYTFTWVNVAAGTYSITAKATDNGGASKTSAPVSVTVNAVCPCTVFLPAEGPTGTLQNDKQALQLGMKFNSSENGNVTGVRFYKQPGNTGTHIGQLYSSTGTLLAEAAFVSETTSGWQQVAFPTPVPITANTTYIISYYSSPGFYSATTSFFGLATNRSPLRGLANGEDGPNGVYLYSNTPAFPTNTFGSNNYWVDVVFNNGTPPVNQAPTVVITSPVAGATFTPPASISIAAEAEDAEGPVAKVEFFQGATLLGEDLTSPFSFTWNNVPAGTYTLTAKATDNDGATTTSGPVSVTVNAAVNVEPTVAITAPANGTTYTAPATIPITADAADADGTIAKVEFYQGTTLLDEDLTSPYAFTWVNVGAGTYSITARATDNAGAVKTSAPVSVTVNTPTACPCNVFKSADAPAGPLLNDALAVQVGMKFRSSENGNITGARFYKQEGNNGTHIGQLYSSTGTLLAEATFVNETESGWQQVAFPTPVAITANTTYVISYHSSSGYYSTDDFGFTKPIVNGPLTGLQKGTDGVNGIYRYSNTPVFPTENFESSNYYVDVVFEDGSSSPNQPPTASITSPANSTTYTGPATIPITADAADADGSIVKVEFYQGTTLLGEDATSPYEFTWANVGAGIYLITVKATDNDGGVKTSDPVSVTVNDATACPCNVFKSTDGPDGALLNDRRALQLGMKFRSSVAGNVTGVRFYKKVGNTGTHIGQLYSSNGTLLAEATFVNETESGWQQVAFPTPVAITANTTYVISYHSSSGYYSTNDFGFNQPIVNGVLTGLQKGADGVNGIYRYSNTPVFPTQNYLASNYYVDVVFDDGIAAPIARARLAIAAPETGLPLRQKEGVTVFPNPTSNKVTVHFVVGRDGAYTVGLYDIKGRLVEVLKQGQAKAGEPNALELDGAKLNNGMYLVRLQTSTDTRTAKIILRR